MSELAPLGNILRSDTPDGYEECIELHPTKVQYVGGFLWVFLVKNWMGVEIRKKIKINQVTFDSNSSCQSRI